MPDQLPMPVTAPFSSAQKAQIINLVRRAAKAEILPRFRRLDRGEVDTKKDENDLVTAADTAAEAMITRGLQTAFPHALVIGEEAVSKNAKLLDGIGKAELSFIIDPIDGTWNFANGLPAFGTMIAACRFGQPVWGLIYDPVGNDLLLADNNTPALWQTVTGRHKPIATRAARPLADLAGYAHFRLMPPADRALMWSRVGALGFVGSLRCSAHEYRLLATGAVDFLLSGHLNAWDHAAGVLICQQAGGKVAMLDCSAYDATVSNGYLLAASSEETWDTLAAHLSDLMSDT